MEQTRKKTVTTRNHQRPQAKIDTNLIETSRRPFIYTPAQLHENINTVDNGIISYLLYV